ncbi:PREDICTED: uncharacterized protein LOC109116421 isoform X3 [Tarenaya hassleriana]|uniref:uncharacterized protein LOC109116421 isoform X3 n=1 Tax=Tarenaya hassleriana TaxID=28532 RepID=UPI0008FD1DC0|nr:PREDICTED: uncharacterized protein LOC109116421 isoform X3 [Tarenaya hassleriana]
MVGPCDFANNVAGPCLLEFGGPAGTFSTSNPTNESGCRELGLSFTTTSSEDSKVLEFSTRTRSLLEKQQFTFTTRRFDDESAHSLLSQRSHQTNLEMGFSHVAHPQPEDLPSPSLLFGYHSSMAINGGDHGRAKFF